ncbi:MAG: hypothetical protein SWY16_10340 [Cyanobacteriota bacterium]|nr:hypothetical protein [Cyanobacteriota bacterium]
MMNVKYSFVPVSSVSPVSPLSASPHHRVTASPRLALSLISTHTSAPT